MGIAIYIYLPSISSHVWLIVGHAMTEGKGKGGAGSKKGGKNAKKGRAKENQVGKFIGGGTFEIDRSDRFIRSRWSDFVSCLSMGSTIVSSMFFFMAGIFFSPRHPLERDPTIGVYSADLSQESKWECVKYPKWISMGQLGQASMGQRPRVAAVSQPTSRCFHDPASAI